jgi:hypothetical protein
LLLGHDGFLKPEKLYPRCNASRADCDGSAETGPHITDDESLWLVFCPIQQAPVTSSQTLDLAEVKERLARLNYYAAQTIKATRGGEKWIALVGQAHERACCFTCP